MWSRSETSARRSQPRRIMTSSGSAVISIVTSPSKTSRTSASCGGLAAVAPALAMPERRVGRLAERTPVDRDRQTAVVEGDPEQRRRLVLVEIVGRPTGGVDERSELVDRQGQRCRDLLRLVGPTDERRLRRVAQRQSRARTCRPRRSSRSRPRRSIPGTRPRRHRGSRRRGSGASGSPSHPSRSTLTR